MPSMTNSIEPLKTENVLDPRLECMKYYQKEVNWGIFKGAEGVNHVEQQCNSYSTSGVTWNFNTQSDLSLIDRRLYARVQFQVTFQGTSPIGQPLLNTEWDAVRAFALSMVTQSTRVTLNGTSVECQTSDVMQGLLHYDTDYNLKEYQLSGTPSCLDNCQQYATLAGSVRNPLSSYANQSYETGRGAFRLDSIVNPVSADGVTPTTSVVTFTVTEPVFVSPMLYRADHLESAMIGIKNIGVQFNFKSGALERVWSHAVTPGVTLTSTVAAIGQGTTVPPSLLVTYLQPPQLDLAQIPMQINYDYKKIEAYVNDQSTTLAPGASQSFTNNAIQLSTIPKAMYIFATIPESDKTISTTESFFRIDSLTMNFLNVSGQFSSMSREDLYHMCLKNGCKMSWVEWCGQAADITSASAQGVGLTASVLKIDVSDLHMPSNMASGMNVNSQLSYTVGLTNVDSVNRDVQLTTVIVYDGIMTINRGDGTVLTQIGIIDEKDVVQTRTSGEWIPMPQGRDLTIYGGNIFKRIWRGIKKGAKEVGKTVKDVAGVVKPVVSTARDVISLKKELGLGMTSPSRGSTGGARAAGMVAGGRMSRSQLKQSLS